MASDADAAGTGNADAGTLIAELERAEAALDDVETEIEAVGEAEVERVADVHDRFTDLLDRYENSATGTGREEFQSFIEFESELAAFEDDLDPDLREREAFEAACERLDRRRLDEQDFELARDDLAPATGIADLIEDREAALTRCREARSRIERRINELDERIDDLEGTLAFADVDFDASLDSIREPIEAYDDAVSEAFRTHRNEAPAREVLDLVATTEAYPLVEFPPVPDELAAYLRDHEVGTEPIPTLIEYADYSVSKLQHYVDDAQEFRGVVGANRAYLDRLDADPLRIEWPPSEAATLRRRVEELVSVVGRFAPEETVALLRRVRQVAGDPDYERLREVARAREQLSDDERERLRSGEVEATVADLREERDRLADALDSFPAR